MGIGMKRRIGVCILLLAVLFSILSVRMYNDKQMKTQTEEYEKQIKNWETKLQDIEDKYYKQFSSK